MNANEIRSTEELLAAAPRLSNLEFDFADVRMRAEVERAQEISRAVNAGLAHLTTLFGRLRGLLAARSANRLLHG